MQYIPPVFAQDDISKYFKDINFKNAIWEWLGHKSPAGSFTKQDLINTAQKKEYQLLIFSRNIEDLSGIEYFEGTGLKTLVCFSNKIRYIPRLPSSLEILNCHANQLSVLPELPSGLKQLICQYNNLDTLPELPKGLEMLICGNNNISVLPILPENLNTLKFENNIIKNLPKLPLLLTELDCSHNFLNVLPELPDTLKTLECGYNELTNLPSLPAGLINLNCMNNYLDVFEGSIKEMIDNCGATSKQYDYQYGFFSNQEFIFNKDQTLQLNNTSILRLYSNDGSSWNKSDNYLVPIDEFTFLSSDESIASIDRNGNIKAHNSGSCYFYYYYHGTDSQYTTVKTSVRVLEPGQDMNDMDISLTFTDIEFRNEVWDWLGKPGLDEKFTKNDLTGRMSEMDNSLVIDSNSIVSLQGLENFQGTGLKKLYCSSILLKDIQYLPSGIEEINLYTADLRMLPKLPESLQKLNCYNGKLSELPELPSGLKELRIFYTNPLKSLPDLPDSLSVLEINYINMEYLPELPPELNELKICGTNIKDLPDLPQTLTKLIVSHNKLASLPVLPTDLNELNCSGNYIDIFSGQYKKIIDDCRSELKFTTPQYRFSSNTKIFVNTSESKKLENRDVIRESTFNGIDWNIENSPVDINDFTFLSSNLSIAEVNNDGMITAISDGTCYIYCMYYGMDYEYMKIAVPVTVNNKVTGYVSSESGFDKKDFKVEIMDTGLFGLTDENGYFEIRDIPHEIKVCNLSISKTSYLKRQLNDIYIMNNIPIGSKENPLILWPGDIPQYGVQDNYINMIDVMSISSCFNTLRKIQIAFSEVLYYFISIF